MTPQEALSNLPDKRNSVRLALEKLPYRSELSKLLKVMPMMAQEAISGSKQLGTQISGVPRDAMRTMGTAVANTVSGIRPDIALAEATMTQMRPDAQQVTPQEKTASLGANIMDPRMQIASPVAGEAYTGIVKPTMEAGGRLSARLAAIPTGVPAEASIKMANEPGKALWSSTRKTAGKIFQAAKENAGVTEAEERLIAGIGDPSAYKPVADKLLEKVTEEGIGSLSVGELLAWKKAAGTLARKAVGSGEAIYAKDALRAQTELLSRAKIDPKIAEVLKTQADAGFAIARSKFASLFPRNARKGDAVLRGLLQVGSGAVNPAAAAGFSPATYFLPAVVAGGIQKGLNVMGQNPAVRQALLGILQNMMQNRQNAQ